MSSGFTHALRIAVAVSCFTYVAASKAENAPRGGYVRWARLKTHYFYWSRHPEAEFMLLNYIRDNTSLDIDPAWAAADLDDLKSLTNYPFVYAEGIQTVDDAKAQANLREYLQRGGFLLIDSCINPVVNPDPDVFLAGQVKRFHEILPKAKVVPLPVNHEIYRSFFLLKTLPQTYNENRFDPRWSKHSLYAVELEGRVVSIISLAALKCGWSRPIYSDEHKVESMRMLVNIYTFALTH